MDLNTIIEGHVKFRDGKKWKTRWCVMRKLSPVADCVHLQLYKDSRDRYKEGLTKASLSLQHFLGLETGFTLDKESNTVAVICQDLVVVLAFDSRERLIQWQVKIYKHLGEDRQFLIQISSYPPKTKLNTGPARMHIQEGRFCLTVGIPPKLAGSWEIKHLRRFGTVDGKFCFEGGSLCGRGAGLYVFLTDQADEISRSVQLASEGRLISSKTQSLRRRTTLTTANISNSPGDLICKDEIHETSDMRSRLQTGTYLNGCGNASIINSDVHRWPSLEAQAELYGHADTSSLADFAMHNQKTKICDCTLENHLGRWGSCVGKLGSMSRCSTAANTPGSINFNPWAMEEMKMNTITRQQHPKLSDDFYYACNSSCLSISEKSKYSDEGTYSRSSDYCDRGSFRQHSSLENIAKKFTSTMSPSKNMHSLDRHSELINSSSPPRRPPKPFKYRNNSSDCFASGLLTYRKTINKPPMPPPIVQRQNSSPKKMPTMPTYNNYDIPNCTANASLPQQTNSNPSDIHQLYDVPKNIGISQANEYPNYDIPPTIIRKYNGCGCHSITKLTNEEKSEERCRGGSNECCYRDFVHFIHPWLQLPFSLHCKQPRFNSNPKTDNELGPNDSISSENCPVYARVDLTKKIKNRNAKKTIDDSRTAVTIENNYTNIDFRRLSRNLNYMNLEFSNSLRYYENVRQLTDRWKDNVTRMNGLNIDMPVIKEADKSKQRRNSFDVMCHVCEHCGYAGCHNHDSKTSFENYVPMSPLKRKTNSECNSSSTKSDSCDNRNANDVETNTKTDNQISEINKSDSLSSNETEKTNQDKNKDTAEISERKKLVVSNFRRLSSSNSPNSSFKTGSGNRDSSSSNDSGFSSGSLKYHQKLSNFETSTTGVSAKRHHSFNQHHHTGCPFEERYVVTPRRTKSSDPLRDLTFQFHPEPVIPKSSSAEAQLPLCLNKRDCCKDCCSLVDATTVSLPYASCRSTSSGTSDMSDYMETLSISSHGSSDVNCAGRIIGVEHRHQSVFTALKPRSGNEYQTINRSTLLAHNDVASSEVKMEAHPLTNERNETLVSRSLETN